MNEPELMKCNNPCGAGISSFCAHSVPHKRNKYCPTKKDCDACSGGKIARCRPYKPPKLYICGCIKETCSPQCKHIEPHEWMDDPNACAMTCLVTKGVTRPRVPVKPELVWCPQSNVCKSVDCTHKKPHLKSEPCKENDDTKCDVCDPCQPYTRQEGRRPSNTDPIGVTNIPKTEPGFYFKDDFTCDTTSIVICEKCGASIPITTGVIFGKCSKCDWTWHGIFNQGVLKTSESTTGKQPIKSSGQPSHGSSFELFSCPSHREVVVGAVTSHRLSLTPRGSDTAIWQLTTTLKEQVVILCACRATTPNLQERSCVLDVGGRVIMFLPTRPVKSAGAANRKSLSASSPTKTSGKGSGTASTQKPQRKRTSGKRHTPYVEIRPIPRIGCQGYSPSDNNDDDDFWYLYWMASHGCTKRTV